MLARSELIFKWSLYAAAALLLCALQGLVFQRVQILGVIPFVYPLLASAIGGYERPVSACVYGVALGVVCDLLLPAPIPCFYTLIFPLVSLAASLIAQSLLSAGVLRALVSALAAFVLTDGFHCLLLWTRGKSAWQTGFSVAAREFCVSLPLLIPVTLLFSAVYRRTHLDD